MYILMGNNFNDNSGGICDAEGIFSNKEDIKVRPIIDYYDSYSILNTETLLMVSMDVYGVKINGYNSNEIQYDGNKISAVLQEVAKLTDSIDGIELISLRHPSKGEIGTCRYNITNGTVGVSVYRFDK